MEGVNAPCAINVLITNDQGIREINRATRNLDKPTDVLSFPMFSLEAGNFPKDCQSYMDPETGKIPMGDMSIPLERAIAEGKEDGHSSRREIGDLTIHAMLHLLGYDHLYEGPEKEKMRAREEKIAASVKGMERK